MLIQHRSPNHNARPEGVTPRLIVVHGTAGASVEGDLAWLCDEAKKPDGSTYDVSLSYHVLVGREGQAYRLVDDHRRAWHAGKSVWGNAADVNDYSLGIGLANDGMEPYTDAQYETAAAVCRMWMERWGIPPERIVGHHHVSPGRKTDPWLHFEWGKLYARILARAP